MFGAERPKLVKPGLFVTATDTAVGKTVITCAIAHALRQERYSVGVCKPFASGCQTDRQGLVSQDAVALEKYANCGQPMHVISPIRYEPPLAPAVVARQSGKSPDGHRIAKSLTALDADNDFLLIEGIGGLLVPLDEGHTVLDFAAWLGYPVVVVTRVGLGTLNHTAMTVRLLRYERCRVAGLVVNEPVADPSDISVASNLQWLEEMNQTPILATVPACVGEAIVPEEGNISETILRAVAMTYWPGVASSPRTPDSNR